MPAQEMEAHSRMQMDMRYLLSANTVTHNLHQGATDLGIKVIEWRRVRDPNT